MKLSIIIPYYNTKEYTDELLECLDKQIIGTPGVEVILIDDGSTVAYKPKHYKWLGVIRTRNRGQARARNRGLEAARGEYIQFIDSDDMVSPHFIKKLLEKIKENPDLIEYSWRSLNLKGVQFDYKVEKQGDRLSNPSACTRCFKRTLIGNARFNELKDATEDEDFSRRVGYLKKDVKTAIIPDYMYFYRTDVVGSNTKNYKNGQLKTKRIVYFYQHVTIGMTDLIEEIRKEDERNEVILLTYQNDLVELERWCQIYRPTNNIWAHYLRGEPYRGVAIIPIPEQYDVILYVRGLHVIGGIESFIYHFGELMKDRNMALVVGSVDIRQRKRLEEHIKVVDYDYNKMYACDTLIMLRILDKTPNNIRCKQSIRMCHGCKTNPQWFIPSDSDFIVNVSEASKETFEEAKEAMVIHNPIKKTDKKALILVSATRIPAVDKGNNETRMRTLAERLNEAEIPFIWFNFSEGVIPNAPRGMVNMGLEMDVQPYIAAADYLVQLSDSEAWSYSMLEALTNNVPVICCPFPSAEEMGVIDGQTGYVIPFDMGFDVNRLLDIPKFEYEYDNKAIKKTWDKMLDHKVKPKKPKMVKVRITTTYNDTKLRRLVNAGEVVSMAPERAEVIIKSGFGEIR